MSVINHVLKNLDSRSSRFTPIEIASVSTENHNTRKSFGYWSIAILVFSIISGLIFYYLQVSTQVAEISNPSIPVQQKRVEPDHPKIDKPVNAFANESLPSPDRIIELNFEESEKQLRLEFRLSEKAKIYLKTQSSNRYSYHLDNAKSEIVMPVIRNNRWIKELSLETDQKGVDISFETTDRVIVNTRQHEKSEQFFWSITFEKIRKPVALKKEAKSVSNKETGKSKKSIVAKTNTENKSIIVDINTSRQAISPTQQLSLAFELTQKRQWQKAESLLLKLLDGSEDLAARKQLLGIYSRPEFGTQYSALARQSMTQYPQIGLFKNEYARSLFQNQAYLSAIELLKSEINLGFKQQALIATSYQRLNQHDKAIEHYSLALELNRKQSRSWIGLGISLEHVGQLKKALKSYQTGNKYGDLNQRLQQFAEQRIHHLQRAIN